MNRATYEMAELLKVSLEEALKVQQHIETYWLLDFSECTQTQFNRVVKSVAKQVLA